MAKFAVGEIAELIHIRRSGDKSFLIGAHVEIIEVDIGGIHVWAQDGKEDTHDYFVRTIENHHEGAVLEYQLRKLPPDNHADDTTEDPGLTLIKKLLEQDTKKEKEHA